MVQVVVEGESEFLGWAQAIFNFSALVVAVIGIVIAARAARAAARSAEAAARALDISETQVEPLLVLQAIEEDYLGDPVVGLEAANPASPAVNSSLELTIEASGVERRGQLRLGLMREGDERRRFSVGIGGGLRYTLDHDARALTFFTVTAIIGEVLERPGRPWPARPSSFTKASSTAHGESAGVSRSNLSASVA